VRVYKNKAFARFARKEGISDLKLREAVKAIETGKIDASLGGGVIKQRLARPNAGKSGGYRTIILYRNGDKAFFVFGFAKNDEENISDDDEKAFRKLASIVLNLAEDELAKQVKAGYFVEIKGS
jgi:hypothetical protein